MSMSRHSRLLIGLTPRLLREVPAELGFRGKTLQFLEQSVPHWVMSMGALIVMLPTIEPNQPFHPAQVGVDDLVGALDGLILQGGSDIDPVMYGEAITHARGRIDIVRDRFECELVHAFVDAGKPVFGICRGMQLLNVVFGGSLHQDLAVEAAGSAAHDVVDLYDEHVHGVRLRHGGWLSQLYGGVTRAMVNSIHHQGVKQLAEGLIVEAEADDGVIEAIRRDGDGFVVGVQWHPEFHDHRSQLLPSRPLMQAFFAAAADCRERSRRNGLISTAS